ncbi:MAG: OsmC family protein [Candidatus Hodarchaeota archaeon]
MKINLKFCENLHFKASVREFENIDVDEPESFHGNNLGPSPIEYFLIGIGSCIGNTLIFCLNKRNLDPKGLEIIIDGQLKHIPPHMHLKLTNINIVFNFKGVLNISVEDVKYCKSKLQEYCPIYQPVLEGIPMEVNFLNFK